MLHIAQARPELEVDYDPSMGLGSASALGNATKEKRWDVVEKLLKNQPRANLNELILSAHEQKLWSGSLSSTKRQAIIHALTKISIHEYEREKIHTR